MGSTTRFVTLAASIAIAAPLAAGLGGGTPSASAENPGIIAFSQVLRRCDYSKTHFNGPTGMGRPTAVIVSVAGNVVANVQLLTAIPDTRYDVRLIQVPRPSWANCWGGDPGVAQGVLFTDATGAASTTLTDAIEPGATGAWVFISRPDAFTQNPAEFYTTDLVTKI